MPAGKECRRLLTSVQTSSDSDSNEASFRWSAMRGEEKQVARIRDTRHSDPTEVVSFNHWLRHPFLGGNSNLRVRDLLHNSVNTGQGFTTESCTRVVTRGK